MARGIIELPLAAGKKELTWYIGKSVVNGLGTISPTVQLRVNRDADFVATRLWLVQWPNIASDALALPSETSAILRDGGTQRALSLQASFNRALILDTDPARSEAAFKGLPSPFLIRNNNNLFAEINNPNAGAVPWVGDLYLVAEGFKVYPNAPEDIPRTIKQYSIPFSLNTTFDLVQPTAAAGNLVDQIATITNNGEGKFLAKSMTMQVIDSNGADQTAALLRAMAINITDSFSGSKDWFQDQTPNIGQVGCPASIPLMHGSFLPFNMPRMLDENAVVQVRFVFPAIAAALAYINGLGGFPYRVSINFNGSLLPR